MKFEDYFFHDVVIKKIEINRVNKDKIDKVFFKIQVKDQEYKVFFYNVYWFNLNLNGGVIGEDTIHSAFVDKDMQDLNILYSKWNGHLDRVELHIYTIEMNSSGSIIKIIASGFKVQD